jgi:hypothetical protein
MAILHLIRERGAAVDRENRRCNHQRALRGKIGVDGDFRR